VVGTCRLIGEPSLTSLSPSSRFAVSTPPLFRTICKKSTSPNSLSLALTFIDVVHRIIDSRSGSVFAALKCKERG